MDEPSRREGSSHRLYRHDPDHPPKWAVKKYGFELAQKIMQNHVELDYQYSGQVYVKHEGVSIVVKGVPPEDRSDWAKDIEKMLKGEYEEPKPKSATNAQVIFIFIIVIIFVVSMITGQMWPTALLGLILGGLMALSMK